MEYKPLELYFTINRRLQITYHYQLIALFFENEWMYQSIASINSLSRSVFTIDLLYLWSILFNWSTQCISIINWSTQCISIINFRSQNQKVLLKRLTSVERNKHDIVQLVLANKAWLCSVCSQQYNERTCLKCNRRRQTEEIYNITLWTYATDCFPIKSLPRMWRK